MLNVNVISTISRLFCETAVVCDVFFEILRGKLARELIPARMPDVRPLCFGQDHIS